jgi:phage terminase small subunit
MKLTRRQRRFVDEYLLDLNGAQAAIRAGYSVNGADQQASELLTIDKVKAAVDRAIAHRVNRVHVKQDRVVQELLRIALANPAQAFDVSGALLPIHEMPEDVQRAISSIDVEERNGETVVKKIRFCDKNRALEMLGRHIGLLKDKNEDGKSAAVFHLVINGIAPREKALTVVDAKALPADTAESGT